MSKARLLIVHPEPPHLALLTSMIQSLGPEIEEAANDRVAVRLLERGGIDLVLVGVDPEDPDALELLNYVRRKHRHLPVILSFSSPSPERMREALRLGASAVLRFPIPATELRASVTQALDLSRPGSIAPASANSTAPHSTSHPAPASAPRPNRSACDLGIVGQDPGVRQAIELAGTVAPTRTPVLITGERGTGKALLARSIHQWSSRADGPFLRLDGSSLDEAAIERELRDAIASPPPDGTPDRNGRPAQERGGTVFLNEVASLSPGLQLQLLRILQEAEFEHGPGRSALADARFVMSSSENLPALVDQGRFRQDLYYRMAVICLKLPPLRHRENDIETLAEHFRARFALEYGKEVIGFTRDALDSLYGHDWPGNVRELEGVIQRGVILCQGTRIMPAHLTTGESQQAGGRSSPKAPRFYVSRNIRPLKEALEEPEKQIIIEALQSLNWNRQETARVLDINRTTLYKKMKKYGLLMDDPVFVN
ncbi:MAG: sigma-54 dependent transcriptional regulator [Singulisphaera sp.]